MAEGSPTAGMQVDGAELARRMTAEAAANAAQSAAAIVEQMKAGGGVMDWFKLLPKPGCFEPKSREQEVALWKDWWWNPLYITDVETIEKSPNTVINFDTMPEATRKRSVFLYGLFVQCRGVHSSPMHPPTLFLLSEGKGAGFQLCGWRRRLQKHCVRVPGSWV